MTASAGPATTAGAFWTTQRRELHAWLHRQAPPLADLYAATLQLLFGPSLPAKARFVGHGVRELANRLPDTLGAKKARFDVTGRMDGFADRWLRLAPTNIESLLGETTPAATQPGVVTIPVELFREMKTLLDDWIASRLTVSQRTRDLIVALAPENASSPETLQPIVRQWVEITNYFMGLVHENLKVASLPPDAELVSRFELFEWSLNNLVGSFYQGLDALDDILDQANS